jgi:hypothetical protein
MFMHKNNMDITKTPIKKESHLESPNPMLMGSNKFSHSMLSNNPSLFNTPIKPRAEVSNLYPFNSELRHSSNASKMLFMHQDIY